MHLSEDVREQLHLLVGWAVGKLFDPFENITLPTLDSLGTAGTVSFAACCVFRMSGHYDRFYNGQDYKTFPHKPKGNSIRPPDELLADFFFFDSPLFLEFFQPAPGRVPVAVKFVRHFASRCRTEPSDGLEKAVRRIFGVEPTAGLVSLSIGWHWGELRAGA